MKFYGWFWIAANQRSHRLASFGAECGQHFREVHFSGKSIFESVLEADQRLHAVIAFTNNSLEFVVDRWHNKGSTNSKSYAAV